MRPTFDSRFALRLAGAALAVRLLFLFLMPPDAVSGDMFWWTKAAKELFEHRNPYETTFILTWPPFWLQILYFLTRVSVWTNWPFFRLVQAVVLAAELGSILAVVWLAGGLEGRKASRTALLVGLALNPVAILLTCQHGNFDAFVALWTLLSVGFLIRFQKSQDPGDWLLGALFLGLGVLTKTVPVVLFPLLFAGSRRLALKWWALALALVFGPAALGLSVLYALSPEAISAHVFGYRSSPGWFGITGLMLWGGLDATRLYGAVFAAGLAAVLARLTFRFRSANQVEERKLLLTAGLLLLSVPALGPGYAPQYLAWSLPFLALSYALFDRTWRLLLWASFVVAALTYVEEYALLRSHGSFLVRLFPTPGVLAWSSAVASPAAQTLARLPLFACCACLLARGVRNLASGE